MIRKPLIQRCLLFFCGAVFAGASSPSTWEMSTFADFVKGKFEGVSLGRDGRLAVAAKLETLFDSGQPVVWAVAPSTDGGLYVATGHRGRVFKVDRDGKSSLLWAAPGPEVFAIAVDRGGALYAAVSPDGKIYRLEGGKATEYFDPKAKYVWALTFGKDGALYAGTGAQGKVYRITGAGQGEEYYATGQANVTSLVADGEGRLLAGTEPNGILYRISAKGKAFVLYDSSLPEIRAVAVNADGSILAAGLGGAVAKKIQGAQTGNQGQQQDGAPAAYSVTVTAAESDIKPPEVKAPPVATAPAAAPQPTTQTTTAVQDVSGVERSAIYRIHVDNTVDTLFSSKEENVYDILTGAEGAFSFSTDQYGRVYRMTGDRKLTLTAQTNEQEVVRLLQWNGAMLAASANMGRVYRMGPAGSLGTYESPVYDAGSVAKWGKLKWQGEGTVAVRTRAGNSGRPDGTWSEWSEAMRAAAGSQIASPNARYLQFRAEFTGSGAAVSGVVAAYLPQNNPPVIRSITVLTQAGGGTSQGSGAKGNSAGSTASFSVTVTDTGDPAAATSTGTATQTLSRAQGQQLMLSWQADDPDGDRLAYQVDFKGEGEREWKNLRRNLHENTLLLDGDALADGKYLFRVQASDKEANAGTTAREAELVSSPVLIDNTAPVVRVSASKRTGNAADIEFSAVDSASALRRAEWSVDAGPWTAVTPVDGILDSETEQFRLHVGDLASGEHVLVIRVADSGGNAGLAKVVLP